MNIFKKYLLTILLLFTWSSAQAFTMPVGIPDTEIAFDQTIPDRPSDWNSEIKGYYYIDATNGSNSMTYGSESQPRKSIPKPAPAGSYIEIAGEYAIKSGGVIQIYGQGTSDVWAAGETGPVWITSSENDPGNFISGKTVIWGDNIFVTNLTFKEKSSVQVGSRASGYAANNIVIRDNEIIGYLTMGNGELLSAQGAESSPTKNIIFYKNTVRDAGDINNATDVDAGLISVQKYASNIWILNNIGYNASGSALQINPSAPRSACYNIYAGYNEFYNVRQSGMWVKYASNVVFSTNYVHNIISTSWSNAKGFGGQYEPDGLWIINNIVHDVEYGVRVPSTNSVDDTTLKIYVIDNIIYNVNTEQSVGTSSAWESAAIHLQGGDERYIYNNLIYNAPNGINLSNTAGYTEIKNNIIEDLTSSHSTDETGYHIWSQNLSNASNISISNNYFGVDSSDQIKVKITSSTYTSSTSLNSALQSNSDELVYNVSGNENVVENIINNFIDSEGSNLNIFNAITNIDNIDYIAAYNTKMKDGGYDISNILETTMSETLSGEKIDQDILSNTRKIGSIDIGPFEASTSESVTLPNAPGNPSVVNK
jgi:hypothetical protein